MKKIFLLLLVVAAVFIYINRQRLYLRDPIARVQRDDVDVVGDVRVMINYTNDVLLEDFSGGKHRLYLVQHWNKLPGLPAEMKCLTGFVCLADADQVTTVPILPGKPHAHAEASKGVSMTDKQVRFIDEDGATVNVSLR